MTPAKERKAHYQAVIDLRAEGREEAAIKRALIAILKFPSEAAFVEEIAKRALNEPA